MTRPPTEADRRERRASCLLDKRAEGPLWYLDHVRLIARQRTIAGLIPRFVCSGTSAFFTPPATLFSRRRGIRILPLANSDTLGQLRTIPRPRKIIPRTNCGRARPRHAPPGPPYPCNSRRGESRAGGLPVSVLWRSPAASRSA